MDNKSNFFTDLPMKPRNQQKNNELLQVIVIWMSRKMDSTERFGTLKYQTEMIDWFRLGNFEKGTEHQQRMKCLLEPLLPILMKSSKNINFSNENQQNILHLCIEHYIRHGDKVNYTKAMKVVIEREDNCYIIESLSRLGVSIIADDQDGNTPLGMVLSKKRMDLANEMLRHNYNQINTRNRLGQTILHILIDHYDEDYKRTFEKHINDFVHKGANLRKADRNGMTPIHLAVKHHLVNIYEIFQKLGVILDFRMNVGDDLLILACKNMNKQFNKLQGLYLINRILSQGFQANTKNNNGFTALHYASFGDNLTLIKNLIKCGADIKARAHDGTNPLYSAILSNEIKIIDYFIKNQVPIDQCDKVYGFSLMHMAALRSYKTKIDWLIMKQLDPNHLGRGNVTPLHLAVMMGNVKIVEKLIEYGAVVNCKVQYYKYTPLHLASMRGQFVKTVRDLIPMDNTVNEDSSLVDYCLKFVKLEPNYESIIVALLEAGANVDAKDYYQRSPLHYLTQQINSHSIVKMLLKAGAAPNDLDSTDLSPVHYCLMYYNSKSLNNLLRYGANINNDQDCQIILQWIKRSTPLSYFLYEHLVKLKIAGLPINNVYESYLRELKFDEYHLLLSDELNQLKEQRFKSGVSVYDVMHMNCIQRFSYINELFDLYVNNPKTPICHYNVILENIYHETVNQKELFISATMALRSITGIILPDLCVEYIFSFFNNRTLRDIVESAMIDEESTERENKNNFKSFLNSYNLFHKKPSLSLRLGFTGFCRKSTIV